MGAGSGKDSAESLRNRLPDDATTHPAGNDPAGHGEDSGRFQMEKGAQKYDGRHGTGRGAEPHADRGLGETAKPESPQ